MKAAVAAATITRATMLKMSLVFMRVPILALLAVAVMAGTGPALARTERITSGEATTALKVALDKGSRAAVGALGRRDGFFGDPRVRIPLPPSLERAESIMRRF